MYEVSVSMLLGTTIILENFQIIRKISGCTHTVCGKKRFTEIYFNNAATNHQQLNFKGEMVDICIRLSISFHEKRKIKN